MVTFGTPKPRSHRELIREQFTRQAVPFANAPAIRDGTIVYALPIALVSATVIQGAVLLDLLVPR